MGHRGSCFDLCHQVFCLCFPLIVLKFLPKHLEVFGGLIIFYFRKWWNWHIKEDIIKVSPLSPTDGFVPILPRFVCFSCVWWDEVNCWDCICPRTSFVQLLVPYKDENGNWAHKLLLFLNRYAYVWKPKVLSLLSFQKTTKVQYKPTNFQIASRLTDEILSCGPGSFSSLQGVESGQRTELGKWTILKCTMTITLGILEHVGWSLTLSKLENKKKKVLFLRPMNLGMGVKKKRFE